MRAAITTCLVLALAAVSATTAGAAPIDYTGSARALLPNAGEAQYDRRVSVERVTPTSGKQAGFLNGWEADYEDTPAVIQAEITVYVYDTPAHALAAYRDACSGCRNVRPRPRPPFEIRTKTMRFTQTGVRCQILIAARLTVYTAVITCGAAPNPAGSAYTFQEARFDAGYLTGFVHAGARLRGN